MSTKWVSVGSGGNTIATSTDLGVSWTGRGANPFTTAGYGVAGPATYADPSLNGTLMIGSGNIFVNGFFKGSIPSIMPINMGYSRSIVYGNGIWVVGTYDTAGGNTIAISSDGGLTWTGKPLVNSGNSLNTLTYANNLWVAGVIISSSPAIIYSSDNWATATTVRNTMPHVGFNNISFAHGYWFTNYNNRIYSTNDSNITSNFINRDNAIIFNQNHLIPKKFVAGKDNLGANLIITIAGGYNTNYTAGNTIAKSTNGSTWTNVPTTLFNYYNSYPVDLAYGKDGSGNGIWMICGWTYPNGQYGGGSNGIIATSYDGTNWTKTYTFSINTGAYVIKWTGTEWYAGCSYTMMKSTDGINWTTTANNSFMDLDIGPVVTYTKPTFIAVGQGGNTIATSNNGTTWTGAGSGVFITAGYGVSWNGKEWVAVGSGGNTIAYSSDGILWSRNSIVFSTQGNDVVYGKDNSGNGLWVVAGQGGNSIATSSDNGNTWVGRGTTVFTTAGWCVAFGKDGSGNRLLVAVGQGTNTIATSTNGTTWTGRGATIFTTKGIGVTYANNLWVAVGQGGNSIATSVNGINWTGLGSTIFTQGNGIRYTINLWVATGTGSNTIATSTNGTTWTGRGTTVFTTAGQDVLGPTSVEPMMTFTVPPRYIEEAPFTITPPTSNSSGLITYTSSNASVATINGTTVTIVGLGTTTISAFQASTEYYISGTIDASFTVNKLVTVLTDFSVPEKSIGDEAFTIIPPTSNSDAEATYTYTSSDTTVATIVGTTITIVGAGTTTITAFQASSERYASGTTTATFIVNKLITTLTDFSVPAKTFGDVSFNLVAPTINRDGAITYTSSNLAVATISGSRVTIVGGGSATITAFQASTPIYASGTTTAPLVVNQATTVLSNFSVPTKTFGNAAFNIVAPTTNGNGAITYTSSDTTVATITNNTITIVGVGSSTITANQASTANYTSGTIPATFTVNQATPVLTNFSVPAKAISTAPFNLSPPTTNGNGTFTYTSSDPTVATIDGSLVTINGLGTTAITALQSSTVNFKSASITETLTVLNKLPLSIGVGSGGNTIATSTDLGLTWSGRGASSFTTSGYGVAGPATYDVSTHSPANSLYIATGANTFLKSTDGTTWTSIGTPIALTHGFVSYWSGTMWIIGGMNNSHYGNNFITSTDNGLTWINRNTTAINYMFGLYNNGKMWVATGYYSNNIATSIDGITWVGRGLVFSSDTGESDVVWGNNTWIAVGDANRGNSIVTSTDGITWTGRGKTIFSVAGKKIAWNGSLFIAVGSGGNSIAYSNNGTSWTGNNTIFTSGLSVAWNQNTWIALGSGGNTIAYSTDGITWTGSNRISGDNIYWSKNLNQWIISRLNNNTYYTSSNGISWSSKTLTSGTIFNMFWTNTNIFTKPTFVAVGAGGNTLVGSTDGTTWSVSPYGSPFSAAGYGVSWNGKQWVAVGSGGNTIAYSSDGLLWTGNNSQILSTQGNDVAYGKDISGNGLWVVTGQGGNRIATSSDGLTWTGRGATIFTSAGWCVAFGKDGSGNRLLVAVGEGTNTIATSTNGITWTGRGATIFTTKGTGVTYANNLWVAVGEGGNSIATSVNGINWTGLGSTIFTQGNGIRYTINLWVATGTGANTIATSTNGTTWTGRGTTVFTAAGHDVLGPTSVEPMMTFTVPPRYIEEAPFIITPPTTNSSGLITYTSSNASVATIDGTTVTILGPGTTTITAFQASTDYYISGTIDASFTVNKLVTVLTNFSVPEKSIGDEAFTIIPPTSNSDAEATYTYTSSDATVATIVGTTITIVGAGTSTITAFQASSERYASGTTTATFIVNKLITTLTDFSVPAKTFGDVSFNLVAPTINRDGLITYTSSNLAVATISGSRVTIVGGGTATITAFQASTPIYASGTITAPLVVNQATTILTNFSVPTKTFGNAAFNIVAPTTNGNGAITYTSSDTTVATITNNTITIVGVGSSTITANQASTANYTSGTIPATFTVNQATAVLTNFSVPTKIVGNAPFSLVNPTTNSNGIITYTSSDLTVATVSGNTITIVGVGSCIIIADQSSTSNYLAGTITASFQVNQITTVLSGFSVPAKQFANADFNLVAPTTNSPGAFTYTSSNTAVATIFGSTVTVVGVGSATITASQASTTNYASGTISATLTVSKATTALTNFSVPAKAFGDASFNLVAPTTNSNGSLTYTSSNTAVATVSGSRINIIGVGTSTITASQATNTNYTAATSTTTLTVNKATTVLTNFSIPVKVIRNGPFLVNPPTTNSNGAFTYTSSNTAVATISGTTITIVGFGTSTITVNQATTANYLAATTTAVFQVNNVTPTLAFSIPPKAIVDAPHLITPPTSNSTGSFTYTSSNPSVATIVDGLLTMVALGTTTITAVQAETADYISGTISATLTVIKGTPGLAFSIPPKNLGDPTFLITPTTGSDGAITYTSSDTSVATIVGNRVTIKAVGTSIITASQASTANYFAATNTDTLIVTLVPTVLTNFSLPLKKFTDIPFKIQASSNSSGAITYTSSDTSIATIVGDMVTIVAAGTTSITATQVSWTNYASATITETLQVDPLTTVLANFSVPQKTFGNAPFSLVNPSSNRPGAFTYTSSDTSVATIDGNMVTIVRGGTSTITATQAGANNYTPETITSLFTVNRAIPVITNFVVPEKLFGDANFNIIDPSSNSNGNFTYTSSNSFVANVVGNIVIIVGAGTCTINAVQASTVSYISGTISASLVVNKGPPTMTNFTISTKTFGNSAFKLTPPTSNSIGAFTYTSSDITVATVARDVVTIVGLGTATITALQTSTAHYTSGSTTTTLTVNQGASTLSNFVVPAKTAGDAAFSLVPPTTKSDGAITYTSSNTSVATIVGNTVTIVGGGTSTITANQASTETFASGIITAPFTVTRISTILTNFSVPQKTFGNATFAITPPTSNSDGLITYTSSNTSVATVEGDVVTIVGAGNTTITAVQAMTPTYASATITVVFQVNPITTVLTNFSVPAKIPGDADFGLVPPSSNSDGAFTYTSSNPAVATIVDGVVTIVGLGSSTISAVQASTTNYTSRTITAILAVNRITTALTNFVVPAKNFGDASFSLVPPTSNSTGAFTYTSSNLLVATIAGDVVTLVGTGSCTITAAQASTFNSTSAEITASLVISRTSPVLTNFSVLAKDFGSAEFKLTPPTTNGVGAFTYTSSDPSVATIARDVVTLVGIGTATITAVQASTANFTSGTITTTLTVSRGTPVLTSFVVGTKKIGDEAFSLVPPTSNSDGAITYTSSDLSVATIDGSTITIVGRGTSTISANQASTTNFLSGTTTALFTVNRITTVLTNFSVPVKTFGDASFNLVAPTSNSDGTFTYTSSDLNVATIEGSTVTIVGGGSATITAVQSSTAIYGSESITALFQVNQIKTVLSDFSVPTKIIGDEAFALVPPITNGDGLFTYTSSNPAVATIDGDVVTILALGSTTIRAVQTSTANYTSDTITTLFQVKLIRTVLTNFVVPTKTVGDVSFNLIPPTTNSTGAFTYRSSNLLVATVAADVVTIVGTGNVTITAFQESTENSTSAQITASLIVNKASNSISWFSVPEKAFGNAPFTMTSPTTASNGAFTYTSSDPAVATIVRDVVTIVGIGTSTITALQARTANYEPGTITAVFTVGQGTPVLTNFSVPAKIVGDATFTITPPSSNSNGAFTYTSSDPAVATIAGDVVTIVGRGTSTITASQASTTNFVTGIITSTLQVNLIPTVLTNFTVATKTFGGAAFTIVPPTTNSDGEFTYTTSDITVAAIDDDVVTIVGAGNAIITAVQASTNSYGVGTTTALFTVDPIRTVLTNFAIPAKIIGEGDFSIARPTTASNGAITYTSSNLTVATIENDAITIVGLGSSIITATQAATDDYTSARTTAIFNVNLITTVLSDFSVSAKIVGDASFSLVPPTTNTAGAFTYTSSNALVATVSADVVTVVGVGTCTITAVQASTPNSTSSIITASLVVSKNAPTITNFSIADKVFGNAAFKLTHPTSTNANGAFTYTSSDPTVATIAKDVVTIIGVGSATITAVQASTASFISGTITTTLTVNSGTPVLTNFSVPTKIGGSAPFSLVAPQSISDGAFTYTSSNTDVATIDGDVVTIVGAGTTTITASQASTDKYLPASVTATFTVNKITTVLTDFAVASKAVGNAAFSLVPPTTNSDGAFTYTSSNLAVATIAGDVVTIVGGGVSTITAVQSGTTNYTSATVTALFRVSALTTVLSNFNIPTKAVGNAPFAIPPPTTNGDGAFTYTSSNTAIATIAGNMMTIVGAGSITIKAVQASSENYTSATISTMMIVNKGTPAITNFVMPVKEIGMADFSIINPTSPSTGEFTYTSSNIKVATIFKNVVSIKGIGTSTITATQAMSANYIGETLTIPFVVNQMSPTLSTAFIVPATKMVGDKTFKLVAPKSNSISPFVYTSSDITVVKIAKDVVTVVGGGTATISGTQAATKSYGPKTVTGTITVTKKTAVLINFSIPPKIVGTAPFAIVPPTMSSNGLITYTSSNEAVATITGNMVTVIGIGSTTITANQASTINFTSGTISTTLVVNLPTPQLGPLQITNKSLSNVSYTIVDPTKPINNTGTWTYSSSDLTKATVSGNVVTLVDSGIVTIRAALSSDSVYNSALLMTQFSISAQDVAPSSFVFVKSSEVAAAIPATFVPSLNVVLPPAVSNPANIAKFNPTLGTIAEKQANQNMVVNALLYMFPMATTISVPTTLLYVPLAFNKSKLKNIKLVRPSGTTDETPLVINTLATDSAVGFLCSILEVGNSVQLNGVGTFVGNFIKITRGANNTYSVIKTTKANVTTTAVATNGDIITFVGITAMIGYN